MILPLSPPAMLRRRAFLSSAAMAGLGASVAPRVASAQSGAIRMSAFYDPADGVNVQPAFQAALDAAARTGATRIHNDLGKARAEMWCPVRKSNGRLSTDGIPLVVRAPVDIDFAGLTITGRLMATNLRAGRAYQAAEIIGGKGHTYTNVRFYDAGRGGMTVFGGPSPGFRSGYPYWFALWDGKGSPPWVTFDGATFERCRPLRIGAWMRGRITTIDTSVGLALDQGHVRDIDLVVDSRCDRDTNFEAVSIGGPKSMRDPVRGLPGQMMRPPSNLRFDVTCSRSDAAQAAGRAHISGFRLMGGLVDADSLDLTLRGEARKPSEVLHAPVPGFRMPRVATVGFRPIA